MKQSFLKELEAERQVSKQKGRLPYHNIFCPDYWFFYPTESSETSSLFWSPLANFFFFINAAQTGSLMSNNGSKSLLSSMSKGWPRAEAPWRGEEAPIPEGPAQRQNQRAQAMGLQTFQACRERSGQEAGLAVQRR